MSNQVKQMIRQTVSEMLADSMSAQNVRRMAEKHAEKVHFVPIQSRVSETVSIACLPFFEYTVKKCGLQACLCPAK